jgi:hypothetical protein
MNILSLSSQNLDNFYQIQTKCYRNSDQCFSPQFTELNEARVPLEWFLYKCCPALQMHQCSTGCLGGRLMFVQYNCSPVGYGRIYLYLLSVAAAVVEVNVVASFLLLWVKSPSGVCWCVPGPHGVPVKVSTAFYWNENHFWPSRCTIEWIRFLASFSSQNRGEKHCIRIPVAFCLYLVKIIQILTN